MVVGRVVRKVVSMFIRNEVIHSFSHAKLLTMSISCDFIFSYTKGITAAMSFDLLMSSIQRSENSGVNFKVRLQELIDWKEVGAPKENGTREGEKSLFNFRKAKRETYKSLLKNLAIVPKNDEQKKQASIWIKELNERLTSIETAWKHRKASIL